MSDFKTNLYPIDLPNSEHESIRYHNYSANMFNIRPIGFDRAC